MTEIDKVVSNFLRSNTEWFTYYSEVFEDLVVFTPQKFMKFVTSEKYLDAFEYITRFLKPVFDGSVSQPILMKDNPSVLQVGDIDVYGRLIHALLQNHIIKIEKGAKNGLDKKSIFEWNKTKNNLLLIFEKAGLCFCGCTQFVKDEYIGQILDKLLKDKVINSFLNERTKESFESFRNEDVINYLDNLKNTN